MASPLSPRPVSPSIYSQSHSSDSTTKSIKSQDSSYNFVNSPLLSGRRSRCNLFDLPFLRSASRIGLRAINSDSKVQQHQYLPKQSELTPDLALDTRASQCGTMEHSLTPRPSRSTFQRKRPPGQPLLGSPSTPNLGSYSTPDLRQLGEKKSTRSGFFKGGLKNLFRRNAPKSGGRGLEISSPLVHHAVHHDTDEDEPSLSFGEMLADQDHDNFVEGKMNNMNISSLVGVAPPSPPTADQEGIKIEIKAEDKVEQKDDGLIPHEREALRLGLELDFSRPDPLLASADMVRAYKDLSSDFYTTRDAGPIYDGSAVNSGSTATSPQNQPEPIGTWRCCKCDGKQELYQYDQDQHLVSILNCACPHKSCENCTLTGDIKLYQPVQEPIPVQLSDDAHKQVNFGVFCSNCGLSWRAQIVKDTLVQKISAVPKDLAKRTAHPLEKLRDARSMSNLRSELSTKTSSIPTKSTLNLRQLSNEMEKEHGKQANSAMVKFSGIQCSCGDIVDASSLCFQIVEPTKKKEVVAPEPAVVVEPSFTATLEDQAKGIGRSTLTLKDRRVRHANPLMSNPVTKEDLETMAMFK